ncbi:MAG: hypothetical protein IPJ75_03785 [Ignavibacteriales bacterium]|nr:hypothetical protein [Ignavibacteriales bacterium]
MNNLLIRFNPIESHFKTPIILLSGEEEEDKEVFRERGVRALVQMPIDKEKLIEAVKSIIN